MKDKTMTKTLCLALLALLLAGCGKQGPGGEIWKEEVRLMNGDLIVIEQRNVYGSSGDVSASHGPLTEAEIRFDYKGTRYEWAQRGLWPKAIQEDPQGRIYVVSTIPYCWAWREWGRPDSYYVVFRHESGAWKKVPVTDVDPGTVFNLAGASSEPRSTARRDYVPETAWKYKDDNYAPNKSILPGYRPRSCQ